MKSSLPRRPAETQVIVLRNPKSRPQAAKNPPPVSKPPAKKRQGGFTMLEIMLVVMIIALLAGAAIHYMGGNVDFAKQVVVKTDIQGITTQLKLYEATNGFYPSTEQGLKALVTQPTGEPKPKQWRKLFDKVPVDPWQSEYNYVAPGTHNTDSFDVFSSGADRKPGTADDLGNWQ